MSPSDAVRLVLDPEDEYCHEPDPVSNYNESMYFNVYDAGPRVGGWFRIGNRVNEGYAEMTCCVYLPDGRVGFAFGRPQIEDNSKMEAGGMRFDVVEPFQRLRVRYDGKVCLLKDPLQMSEPRTAFVNNPQVPCAVDLEYTAIAPIYGGKPVKADGSEIEIDPEKAFAKAHYEQHLSITGTILVDGECFDIDGYGLRDKSWGPRYWQSLDWYRWLPISFGPGFGMGISIISTGPDQIRRGGMVLVGDRYETIRDAQIETEWDENDHQTSLHVSLRTDQREYQVTGRVLSLIPLRNRRKTPDGQMLLTRLTEGMTEYRCDGRTGYGLSEYLDQIVDGRPLGRTGRTDLA